MRVSDETLYEGVSADMVPDGGDVIVAFFDAIYGTILILVGLGSLIFVPRRRGGRHRA